MNTDRNVCAPTKWGAEIRADRRSIKGVAEGIKGFWHLTLMRYHIP
jgi:hypothetical protein